MGARISSKTRTTVGLFLAGLALLVGWRLFGPRYQLPSELKAAPCAAALRKTLTEVTQNQGGFRTDAGLTDLRMHKSFAETFDVLKTTPLKEYDFYWVKLRTYHMLWAGSVSAPFRDFVIVVDCQKANGVWSFSEETFTDDLKSFISDVGCAGNNEKDVRTLGTLCHLLSRYPVREFAIRQENGRTWFCISETEQYPWKISFTFNEAGELDDFAFLP